jgi:hypothetical protein
MSETSEQRIARIEIKMALENLLRACGHNNAVFCGFVYGAEPPFIIRFGNMTEEGEKFKELMVNLCDLVEERSAEIVHDPLEKP